MTDVNTDQANKRRDRPLASGLVSKRDAIVFILLTNVSALSLAIATANIATILSLIPLLSLGPLYSLPRFALKDRFILKTLSIAAGMILCLVLGATANFSGQANQQWSYMFYGAAMVGMMIFVTSPYNDLADIVGDSKSGRRTIPLVLGQKATLILIAGIAACMSAISWVLFSRGTISWLTSAFQSVVSAVAMAIVLMTLNKSSDQKMVRKMHSKLAPLHTLMHVGIICGALLL